MRTVVLVLVLPVMVVAAGCGAKKKPTREQVCKAGGEGFLRGFKRTTIDKLHEVPEDRRAETGKIYEQKLAGIEQKFQPWCMALNDADWKCFQRTDSEKGRPPECDAFGKRMLAELVDIHE